MKRRVFSIIFLMLLSFSFLFYSKNLVKADGGYPEEYYDLTFITLEELSPGVFKHNNPYLISNLYNIIDYNSYGDGTDSPYITYYGEYPSSVEYNNNVFSTFGLFSYHLDSDYNINNVQFINVKIYNDWTSDFHWRFYNDRIEVLDPSFKLKEYSKYTVKLNLNIAGNYQHYDLTGDEAIILAYNNAYYKGYDIGYNDGINIVDEYNPFNSPYKYSLKWHHFDSYEPGLYGLVIYDDEGFPRGLEYLVTFSDDNGNILLFNEIDVKYPNHEEIYLFWFFNRVESVVQFLDYDLNVITYEHFEGPNKITNVYTDSPYNQDYLDGFDIGYLSGKDYGYNEAKNEYYDSRYTLGYEVGNQDGYDEGFIDGLQEGYDIGYDIGYDVGLEDGTSLEVEYYSIGFYLGEDLYDTKIKFLNQVLVLPLTPVKEGYNFLGWYYEEDFETKFNIVDPINDNLTLYGKFGISSGGGGNPLPTDEQSKWKPIYILYITLWVVGGLALLLGLGSKSKSKTYKRKR